MIFEPIVISLPIADRQTAHDFYRDALGLEAIGEPAEDGVPEPLQFALNAHSRLMLVPRGGFGWVVGDKNVADPGRSECLLSIKVSDEAAVRDLFDRCVAAGADAIREPGNQPWGFQAIFADLDRHLWMIVAGH